MFVKLLLKRQVTKFAMVGACCAAIEFIVFSLLVSLCKIEYLVANVVSVVIAIALNYILSRKFVFQPSKYVRSLEILSFVVFSVMAILLNQSILWLFIEKGLVHNIEFGKATTILIVAIFNFATKKYIVFKQ